ncbi:MAG: hypothetical protein KDA17_06315 [Candidatus Saccharibacteria bacterium]|nr:hypothetical protein [Candidatus Saccharibacteria bacterium]
MTQWSRERIIEEVEHISADLLLLPDNQYLFGSDLRAEAYSRSSIEIRLANFTLDNRWTALTGHEPTLLELQNGEERIEGFELSPLPYGLVGRVPADLEPHASTPLRFHRYDQFVSTFGQTLYLSVQALSQSLKTDGKLVIRDEATDHWVKRLNRT